MKPRHVIAIAAIVVMCWSATSCTISTPNGTATLDASAVEIARIISEK